MRIAEITYEGRSWSPLVLHPELTVIWGEPQHLTELAEVLVGLYSLAGSTVGGTIEYSGFSMPLDQTAMVSLDIHTSGLRTLDVSRLEQSRAEIRADLVSRVGSRMAELDTLSTRLTAEAEALRRRQAAAAAAVTAVTEELDRSTHEVDELVQRHESAMRRPQELRAALDAACEAQEMCEHAVEVARATAPRVLEMLDPSGAEIAGLRLGSPCPGPADVVAEARTAGLIPAEQASLLGEWLTTVTAGTAEVSREITGMLEEAQGLDDEWRELSARGVEGDLEVMTSRERLEEVTERVANLEELADSGLLAARARTDIDAAHDAGEPGEEQRVLELYGFDSHLDYTIALSTRSVGEKIEAIVHRARGELARATDALELAREQAARSIGELNQRRDGLRLRITVATGVEPESLSTDVLATIPQPPDELLELSALVPAAVNSLEEELEVSNQAVVECRADLDALADPEIINRELQAERARLVELETLSQQAEQVHLLAAESLESVESKLAALLAEQGELHVEHSVLQPTTSEAVDTEPATSQPTPTEVAVVIRAATEQVAVVGPDPTPVLLVDSFSSLGRFAHEVLEAVVASAPGVQVVYLTSDEAMVSWARHLRPNAGALLRLGRRRWFARRLGLTQPRQSEPSSVTPASE